MEIKIEPQDPDGWNITISNLVVDTDDQVLGVFKIIRMLEDHGKLDLEECLRIYKSTEMNKQPETIVGPIPRPPQQQRQAQPTLPPRMRDNVPFEVSKELDRRQALEDKEWLNDDGSIRG